MFSLFYTNNGVMIFWNYLGVACHSAAQKNLLRHGEESKVLWFLRRRGPWQGSLFELFVSDDAIVIARE